MKGSDAVLVVLDLPLAELICGAILAFSVHRARKIATRDSSTTKKWKDEKRSHGKINLMLVRCLALTYCISYVFLWIFAFPVNGAILPLKNRSAASSNVGVKALGFLWKWVSFASLPAAALAWIFFYHGLFADMNLQKQLPWRVEVGVWVMFSAAAVVRLVFGVQSVEGSKFIDKCGVPFSCMLMWFTVGIFCTVLLRKIYVVQSSLDGRTMSEGEKKLVRRLIIMAVACVIAVVGRTIQFTNCHFVTGEVDAVTFKLFKRLAAMAIIIMDVRVTWVPDNGNSLLNQRNAKGEIVLTSTGRSGLSGMGVDPNKEDSLSVNMEVSSNQSSS